MRVESVSGLLVSGEVDEAHVEDELNDLEPGDPFLPPDSDTSSSQEVVPVHDDVYAQVQSDWHPSDGGVAYQLDVAEQCCGAVVVSM